MNPKKEAGAACQLSPHLDFSGVIIPQGNKSVRISTPNGTKYVGKICQINGEVVYYKEVNRSEHLLNILNAWGFQIDVISELTKRSIEKIVVYDKENAINYITNLDTLIQHGIRKDLGHGNQIFLQLKYWNKNNSDSCQLSLLAVM